MRIVYSYATNRVVPIWSSTTSREVPALRRAKLVSGRLKVARSVAADFSQNESKESRSTAAVSARECGSTRASTTSSIAFPMGDARERPTTDCTTIRFSSNRGAAIPLLARDPRLPLKSSYRNPSIRQRLRFAGAKFRLFPGRAL